MIASRYGWTYSYIMWGIPYATLRMMLADAMRIDYKADSTHMATGSKIPDKIDMNRPESVELLRGLASKA